MNELSNYYLMITAIINRSKIEMSWESFGTGREVDSPLTVLFAHLSSRSGELPVFFDYDIGSISWGEAGLVLHLQVICDQMWLNEMCPQREKEPFSQRQRIEIQYMHRPGRAQLASFILGRKELSIVTKSVRRSE